MKYHSVALAVFLGLFSCAPPANNEIAAESVTLHGSLFATSPVAGATITALSGCGENEGQQLGKVATTDAAGKWSVELGPHQGPITLKATSSSLPVSLEAVIPDYQLGSLAPPISINPITHLQTAYAKYLLKQGWARDKASAMAVTELNRHFGGLDFLHTNPLSLPTQEGKTQSVYLSDSAKEAFVLKAFEVLAANMSVNHGLSPDSAITWAELLNAAAEDIESDGVFDGVGFYGKKLHIHNEELDGETFRTRLSHAVVQAANHSSSKTLVGTREIEPLARNIYETESRIFSQAPSAFTSSSPAFLGCKKTQEGQTLQDLNGPQSGAFWLQCSWSSSSDISAVELLASDVPVENIQQAIGGGTASLVFWIDTRQISQGSRKRSQLSFRATSLEEIITESSIHFTVDNLPPVILVENTSSWVAPNVSGLIRGTTSKLVRRIDLSGEDLPPQTLSPRTDDPNVVLSEFAFSLPSMPCDKQHLVTITATDLAGNQGRKTVSVNCTSQSPSLYLERTAIKFENSNEFTVYGGDSGWPREAVSFVRKPKDFVQGRIDINGSLPESIPCLRFRSMAGSSSSPEPPLKISFTYAVNGDTVRPKTKLEHNDAGFYVLPISYESLVFAGEGTLGEPLPVGPNPLSSSKPEDEHRLFIFAEDLSGNESSYVFPFRLQNIVSSLALHPTTHRSDLSDDYAIVSGDTEEKGLHPTFTKLVSRFEFCPESGKTIESQNLPYFLFQIDSSDKYQPDPSLKISYRHIQDGQAKTPYRALNSDWDGSYYLPVSLQTLTEKNGIATIDAWNALTSEGVGSVHQMEVKVEDTFGNVSLRSLPFRLSLSSPKVLISNCRFTPAISQSRYEDLRAVHDGTIPTLEFELSWGDEHDSLSSLQGVAPLEIDFSPQYMTTSSPHPYVDQRRAFAHEISEGLRSRWRKCATSSVRGKNVEYRDNEHEFCFAHDGDSSLETRSTLWAQILSETPAKPLRASIRVGDSRVLQVSHKGLDNPFSDKSIQSTSDEVRGYEMQREMGALNGSFFVRTTVAPSVSIGVGPLLGAVSANNDRFSLNPEIIQDESCSEGRSITWDAKLKFPRIK